MDYYEMNIMRAIFMKFAFVKSLSGYKISTKAFNIFSFDVHNSMQHAQTDFCIPVRDITSKLRVLLVRYYYTLRPLKNRETRRNSH